MNENDLESLAAAATKTSSVRSQKPNSSRKSNPAKAAGCLLVLGALAIGIVAVIATSERNPATAPERRERIAYEIVEEWTITNGGYGRAIVVNPASRNETDLIELARQLKRETSQDRNAFVFIYDDTRAAALRKAAIDERVSKADEVHHDAHMIGSYSRNGNTGYHALMITLEGAMGPSKVIEQ